MKPSKFYPVLSLHFDSLILYYSFKTLNFEFWIFYQSKIGIKKENRSEYPLTCLEEFPAL